MFSLFHFTTAIPEENKFWKEFSLPIRLVHVNGKDYIRRDGYCSNMPNISEESHVGSVEIHRWHCGSNSLLEQPVHLTHTNVIV